MKIIKVIDERGVYHSRYFNDQHARRSLIQLDDGAIIEVTSYKHYRDGAPVDIAVDIPTMVGCPVRCKFCAAHAFQRKLTAKEMEFSFLTAIDGIDISEFPVILASYQGIGESMLNYKNVSSSFRLIQETTPKCRFSASTAVMIDRAIAHWVDVGISISSLQISITGKISPLTDISAHNSSIHDFLQSANRIYLTGVCNFIKFNYLLIENVTDTNLHLENIIGLFSNGKFDVKISHLNKTNNSTENSFSSAQFLHAQSFVERLIKNGVSAYLYGPYRSSEMSCGQLVDSYA